MNEIAELIRTYKLCNFNAAVDEIDRLEKVIADQRKELDARENILNQIQEACGSGWWFGAIDSIKSMKFEVNDMEKIIEYQNGFIESLKEEIRQQKETITNLKAVIEWL